MTAAAQTGRDPHVVLQELEGLLNACGEVRRSSAWLELFEEVPQPPRRRGLIAAFRRTQPPPRAQDAQAFRQAAEAAFGHANRAATTIGEDGGRTILWDWRFDRSRMAEALSILAGHPVARSGGEPAATLCVQAWFVTEEAEAGPRLPEESRETEISVCVGSEGIRSSRLLPSLASPDTVGLADRNL